MKRTVETTVTKTVNLCDRCHKQIDHLRSCQICRREVGFCCGTTLFLHEDNPGLIDIGLHCCNFCAAAVDAGGKRFVEVMRNEVRASDAVLMAWLNNWRKWAKRNVKRDVKS